MSLEYNILWVDDDVENLLDPDISSLKHDIETYLKELGYIPSIQTFEDISSAEKELFQANFDLILSDYNMYGGNGDILIKEIRKGNIYTEVLFYTGQAQQIENIAKSLFADRVSFHNLKPDDRNNQEFKEKIIWLINQTLKKLQELNAVRGLVMAETSRLDRMIEDILIEYFNSDDEKKETLKKYILDKIKDSLKSNFLGDTLKIAAKTYIEIVKSRVFDAYKKSQTLQKLISLKKLEGDFTHEKYYKDVIQTRNELAHSKSEKREGKEVLIIENAGNIEEKEIKQEDIIDLRKNILKYDEILKELKDKI